ncbi:hypothetical protein [Lactiplantibacillus carotarum]|uniref:hypothetical protein n=1 Tax=Lactiplantibacillus carotarum TaxID=2993456 RepID=UPI00298F067D|nr:hypothetical protein [Lactiplantibacillus carotarum]
MASNVINLTNGPQEYAEFKVGKVTKKLYFNDELNLEIANTQLSVGKRLKELSDTKKMKDLDDKTVDQQRKYLTRLYADLRKVLYDFFDEQFGEGVGKQLYQLTGKSTERMAVAFNMVVREYEELRDQRDSYIDTLYKSRKALKQSHKK